MYFYYYKFNLFIVDNSTNFYDEQWNAFYGTSRVDVGNLDSQINNYGAAIACGGSIMTMGADVYRSFDGGVAPLDSSLDIVQSEKIGNYDPSHVYHVEVLDNSVWFCLTDYASLNQIKSLDLFGNELHSYDVGIAPGDIAFWQKSQ